MEIRNNLISRLDINSISKTKQVHHSKQEQYASYKVIAELINKPSSDIEVGFINVVTNHKIGLTPPELMLLADSTMQYFDEQSKNTKGNNVSICVPLVEIVNTRSNPRIVVELPGSVKRINSAEYNILCGPNITNQIITAFILEVRKVANLKDKKKLTILVAYRPGEGNTLQMRMQVLDVLLTKPAIAHIANTMTSRGSRAYADKYNEWYLCNFVPFDKKWECKEIYINKPLEGYVESLKSIPLAEFVDKHPNLPFVFSVNEHADCTFRKQVYNTEFDSEKVIEANDDSAKLQLFIDEPSARYYDLILKYIPLEYKTNKALWKELIKTFKRTKCKILFKEYSESTEFAEEFEGEWCSRNNVEPVHPGYYHQLCLTAPNFKGEFNGFLEDYVETLLYKTKFKILDKDAAKIIYLLTCGTFYTAPSKKDPKQTIWWMYVSDSVASMEGEVHKWRKCDKPNDIIMPIVFEKYYNIVKKVVDKISLSFENGKFKTAIEKKLDTCSDKIGGAKYPSNMITVLESHNKLVWFNKYHDSYADILGTLDGIIDLNVAVNKPKIPPQFITGYSKYFITDHANAYYRPFSKSDPACKFWLDFMKSIVPEKDAREVLWYYGATGCDQACKINQLLQLRAPGSNGKSTYTDNLLYVFGDKATKLSVRLLTEKNKGGAADPDYMQMEGRNLGIISETDDGDKIISSRLKSLNETVKTGRSLFENNKNFKSNCTVILSTNFALEIYDTDDGTWRRNYTYYMPFKFVQNPNPAYPNEKKGDKRYETMAADNQEYADSLLACLVHKRIKFHHKYNSDIEVVPKPTIDKYTNQYKVEQNKVVNFLYARLVLMYGFVAPGIMRNDVTEDEIVKYYTNKGLGYEKIVPLEEIVKQYIEWYKTIGVLNKGEESLKREFRESRLDKFLHTSEDERTIELHGYRLLARGEKKQPEEEYFM